MMMGGSKGIQPIKPISEYIKEGDWNGHWLTQVHLEKMSVKGK